ncbi:MAG TPA: mechanosensitive ion channel domain-containing protein, partial [Verrucomicrobiae bacterium]
ALGALRGLAAEQTNTVAAAQPKADGPIQDKIITYVIEHSGALIGAVIIIVVGVLAARLIGKLVARWLEHRTMEPPVRTLLVRLSKLLVLALALMIALETIGFKLTVIIAGMGVAGVGVGLAMQGVLSNVVAGLTIIFTKPFRVGEYVELLGCHGQVVTIELFSTTLVHADKSRVVVPNRRIVGEILHNYGAIRQLELSVGVAYDTDLNQALGLAREILSVNPRVLKDPAPSVGVGVLADSSIIISFKPWTNLENFGPAGAELNKAIVERFRGAGIEIPFPQREVRFINGGSQKLAAG